MSLRPPVPGRGALVPRRAPSGREPDAEGVLTGHDRHRDGELLRTTRRTPDGSLHTVTHGPDGWTTLQRHDAEGRLTLTRHTRHGRLNDPGEGQPAVTLHGTDGHEVRLHYRDGVPTDPSPAIPAIHTRDPQGRIVAGIHYRDGRTVPTLNTSTGVQQAALDVAGTPRRRRGIDR